MHERLGIILDRLTAIITNLMQENAELRRELKEQERVIATLNFRTRSKTDESL